MCVFSKLHEGGNTLIDFPPFYGVCSHKEELDSLNVKGYSYKADLVAEADAKLFWE